MPRMGAGFCSAVVYVLVLAFLSVIPAGDLLLVCATVFLAHYDDLGEVGDAG
jgi:hypothetical protein